MKRLTRKELIGIIIEQQSTIDELEGEVKSLNAFLVHKGFAEEYIRWKGDVR